MSERRYVVEIARAVADDRIESASDYVAQRLGMDKQRIRTLLSGRTGPVTRPVLAEKADSIAEVFTDAGVTVMIVEAPDAGGPHTGGSGAAEGPGAGHHPAPVSDQAREPFQSPDLEVTDFEAPDLVGRSFELEEYEQDEYEDPAAHTDADPAASSGSAYEYRDPRDSDFGSEGYGPTEDPAHDWNVDSAWETQDDDMPWHREPAQEPAADRRQETDPTQAPDTPRGHDQHRDHDTGSVRDPNHGRDTRPRRPPAPTRMPAGDPEDVQLPSTRWVPSPFDDPTDDLSSDDARSDDVKVTWLPTGDRAEDDLDLGGIDDLDTDDQPSRPWVTPGHSPFGELAQPEERTPLRSFLLWALVVSVVLLIALQLLFAVRERGVGAATYESGLRAYSAGDFVTARRHWEDVAESGDPQAQFMLGHLVQNGLGQPWSNAAAARWYRLAADQGLPEAQTALADLYLRGVGVEPSLETGAQLLQRAAASDYPPAVYQFAELLLHGRGVQQDFDAALALFTRAAESGSSEAADFVALADHVRTGAQAAAATQ